MIDYTKVGGADMQAILTPRMSKYVPYNPTPKQTAFLLMNDQKEILYGGAAGGGKSVAQLMAALQYVDIPGYSAILYRKTYADLSQPKALIDLSKQWLMPYVNTKEIHWSEKEKKYTFPSSATLNFGYLDSENDCYNYQGAEFHYIGMDEVTHISPGNYRYMFSRLRKPKHLDVPLRFRATSNPGGMFGEFYYNRFLVDGKANGRVFISAGLDDNPYLDKEEYTQALNELDPVTRAQLLDGNWEIKETGELFKKEWFKPVPRASIPSTGVRRCRFWDMASTDPEKATRGRRKKEPDYTVGFRLCSKSGIYWIEDIIRVKDTPHNIEKLVKKTATADGMSCAIRMEQEPGSSGDFTIDNFARRILQGYDFMGVRSTGSKSERARAASAASESGRVMYADDCRNIQAFLDECIMFPKGVHDDTVDGFSGAFNYFKPSYATWAPIGSRKKGGSYWKKFRR